MATLQKLGEEDRFPLSENNMGIGRAPDNEIVIEDVAVSNYHAMVTVRQSSQDVLLDEYVLEDLDSTNKTFVNNHAIAQHVLKEGDIIRVGETRLKFSTKKYVRPKIDFQKTTRLSGNKAMRYAIDKTRKE